MAWMKLETSVARNRKFVKAGPAPSWLWVCGVAYCQEGLTDGFIPDEALEYLGVKNGKQLAAHLVKAGLWDVVEGGWYVHDYLEHNKPAWKIKGLTEDRRHAGAVGGVASGQARRTTDQKHEAEANAEATREATPEASPPDPSKHPANPDSTATATATDRSATATAPTAPALGDGQVSFATFQMAYPEGRRKGGYHLQTVFFAEATKAGGTTALMNALENHKHSEQWQNPKLIPGMDTWLNEERWRQRLEPPGAATPAGKPLPAWAQKGKP